MYLKILALAAVLSVSATAAVTAQSTPTVVTPAQVQLTPGTGPLSGAQVAVLSGAMDKPGPYVARLKLPDGAKLGPHYHADTESVTVLQGTLLVGIGDSMDPAKMAALPAGSLVVIPAGVHHYAMAKGETIVQLNGVGPFQMTTL